MNRFHESGQIGLIVLLISAVMMTIGLGVASQSVFESKSAGQEVESTETFNAAEQGIEQALSNLSVDEDEIDNLSTNLSGSFTNTPRRTISSTVEPGKSANIILADGTNTYTGTLPITWTNIDACDAAIIVTVISNSTSLTRQAFQQECGTVGTGFTRPSTSGGSLTCTNTNPYTCTARVTINAGAQLARIKVVGNSSQISIPEYNNMPVQYHEVKSTATNAQETRTLEVSKSVATLPSIFDYVLFSGSGNIPQ